MNKKLVFVLLLLGAARVFPITGSVNNSAANHATQAPALVADSDPRPASILHNSVLVADGDPMPAPIPHRSILVADGDPMPAPIPHGGALVADGDPMPPPIPHAHESMVVLA
jgi:hypothetical protein